MRTKDVRWAYPTSETATELGHGKTGCWVLRVMEGEGKTYKCRVVFNSPCMVLSYAKGLDITDAKWAYGGGLPLPVQIQCRNANRL